ncbi:MAG TPA: pilus assembly protein TadG-related protein [Acidobacteriaceae bacterium]
MKLIRDERGQTMIVTALCIASLCGAAGFAVDVGKLFQTKRTLQTAADAAAIAGANEMRYGDWSAAAKQAAADNGYTDGVGGVSISVHNPPSSGSHSSGVEVVITDPAPTYFMKVFHLTSMNVSARAVAGLVAASGCIYTLDTSGTDIGLTGTADLNMPNCGILVDSAASNAIRMTGSSGITAQSIGIVGGYSASGSAGMTPAPVSGIAPAPDPLAYLSTPSFTSSACLPDPHKTGTGAVTLGPSISGGTVCYNGLSVSGSGSVTLSPGLYIINGGFSMTGSGTISGTGVTFFLAAPNGSASLSGSGSMNLSAPTTGTYSGILFFEDPDDSNAMTITGSTGSNLQGVFYAPSAALTMSGTSGANIYADLVVSSLSMTGTSNFQNYATVNPDAPLKSAALTE